MTDDFRIGAIALNCAPFMTPTIFRSITKVFDSPLDPFGASIERLTRIDGLGAKLAESIGSIAPEKRAAAEIERADRLGASIVTIYDDDYPDRLKNIFAPPPALYVKGERAEDTIAISIVGSRKLSSYGRRVTDRFSSTLAEWGVTIVSGLARGIDRQAHKAALSVNGRTVAILGNGLDIYYPPENRALQEEIARSGGAVISQFPFRTSPSKLTFPTRNHVIAGFSLGSLIVEAALKSGALITAGIALDEGREVFAVPGPIDSPMSAGTNLLIQKGTAKPVLTPEDIVEEIPLFEIDKFKRACASERANALLGSLSDEERLILQALESEEAHIDKIAAKTGIPVGKTGAILLALELKGLARQSSGSLFHKA